MPRKKLSALAIPQLPEGEYLDAHCPGLILRVGTRRRTWQYRYRSGGKQPRAALGYFPAMGLSEARAAAGVLAQRIEAGAPPLEVKPHPRSTNEVTLAVLLDRYEAHRERENRRIKTLTASMQMLRAELKPYLGLPARQFSKADLRETRDRVAERGLISSNRLLDYIGPFMRWAAQEDLIETNFVPDIRRVTPERKHERVLTAEEIAAIWRGAGALDAGQSARAYGRMARFLLVTAQRRDEAASLRHGDILGGIWKQSENKSDRPHSMKLPELALQQVGSGQAHELAFRGISGKMSGWSKLKRALDVTSGVTDWRLHDLRRTAASGMQDLGVPPDVIETVLNHAIRGVAGVYLRAELQKQKADALTLWARELEGLVGKDGRTRTRA